MLHIRQTTDFSLISKSTREKQQFCSSAVAALKGLVKTQSFCSEHIFHIFNVTLIYSPCACFSLLLRWTINLFIQENRRKISPHYHATVVFMYELRRLYFHQFFIANNINMQKIHISYLICLCWISKMLRTRICTCMYEYLPSVSARFSL